MKLFRKRFIPNETIDISSDEVLKRTDDLIVTKWLPIHPRGDIFSGMSWTYFKDGYKISKFYDQDGNLLYYYCDIIDYSYDEKEDSYTFIDLLVDIKYYPDGKIEFLDFDELQEAYSSNMIDGKLLLKAISNLNKLANIIYDGEFEKLCINLK